MVEEYISLKSSNPKFSKSEFAYQKWVLQTQYSMIGWLNIKDMELDFVTLQRKLRNWIM